MPVGGGRNRPPYKPAQTFRETINVSAMRRGRMYAARSGVLGGARIWDGRMVPVTSGVGRGLDPAVVPGRRVVYWVTAPFRGIVGRAFTPAAGRLRLPGTCRAGGTFAVTRNVLGRRERPRAAYMPPLRPSVLSIMKPGAGGVHSVVGGRNRPPYKPTENGIREITRFPAGNAKIPPPPPAIHPLYSLFSLFFHSTCRSLPCNAYIPKNLW